MDVGGGGMCNYFMQLQCFERGSVGQVINFPPPPKKNNFFLKSEGKEFRKKNKMKMDVGGGGRL